ncbi:MAG: multifunctional CCA addition/repair protein [Gammaproteobacteria bacterium]|nr:multifunctional CCA addition/repair protein [Gammaproteobacteria bacterium]
MKVYLVGGAVRDGVLGIYAQDKDWVVVGSTPQQMLTDGYLQVGKDFPVFLHPKTKDEYALARTERKSGKGYTGFSTQFSPDVTLEEDLARRDLTVNAIAKDSNNQLVDPFGGLSDIKNKILRHVTPAFVEDPLRVLRVARFKARFHKLGFVIAAETNSLMREIVLNDELQHLTPERVWVETQKALLEDSPEQYFYALNECGALEVVFPEIFKLFGVPQRSDYHPEVDAGLHTMMVLAHSAKMKWKTEIRFAAVVHDLGKADTDPEILPKHIGHEKKSAARVKEMCARLKVPKSYEQLALLVAEFHTQCHQALSLKSSTVLKLLERLDAFRRPERLDDFVKACEADAKGRKGFESTDYPQAMYLLEAYRLSSSISVDEILASGYQGAEIGVQLRQLRIKLIENLKQTFISP